MNKIKPLLVFFEVTFAGCASCKASCIEQRYVTFSPAINQRYLVC